MTNKTTWFEKNRNKKIASLVDKAFLVDALELLLRSGYLQQLTLPSKNLLDGLPVRIEVKEMLTEDAFYNLFLPLMNDEGNQEDAIAAFTHNRLFRKFMSELLYNNIKGFLLDKNVLKQVPIAGRMVSAGQNIGKKAGQTFSGISETIEKRIMKFIEQNIGAVTNFSVNFARKSITPETVEKTLAFVWEHLSAQKLTININLSSQSEIDAEAMMLHFFEALIDALLDKYGHRKLGDFSLFF